MDQQRLTAKQNCGTHVFPCGFMNFSTSKRTPLGMIFEPLIYVSSVCDMKPILRASVRNVCDSWSSCHPNDSAALKINMEPENDGFQKGIQAPLGEFLGICIPKIPRPLTSYFAGRIMLSSNLAVWRFHSKPRTENFCRPKRSLKRWGRERWSARLGRLSTCWLSVVQVMG